MKILLIWPIFLRKPRVLPPIGIAYIASSLESVGHSVKIIDPTVTKKTMDDVEREIKSYDPDVVGFSATTSQIHNVYKLAEKVKENNPNCETIVGGPHATALPVDTLKECPHIDVVVKGEGEETIVELLEKDDYEDIKGITFRKGKKIVDNPDRGLIKNLDELPFPAYHLLPMDKYTTEDKELFAGISTSRGCPYNCTFCESSTLWQRRWRARSPDSIIEEMKLLVDEYNIKKLFFVEDLTTVKEKRMKNLCSLLQQERLDVKWSCPSRVNLINREICEMMKKAGCQTVGFGIESGNQKTIDFFNKGITLDEAVDAVETANKAGLNTDSNFILGVPFETRRMILDTIRFSQRINLTFVTYSILTPYPGTKIYKLAKQEDLLLTDDWSKYTCFNPVLKMEHLSSFELRMLYFYANLRKKIVKR